MSEHLHAVGSTVRDERGWLYEVTGHHPDGSMFITGLAQHSTPGSTPGAGGPIGPFTVTPSRVELYAQHHTAAAGRPTATVRDLDDKPLDRDEYAEALSKQAKRVPPERRPLLLGEGEAQTAAALLDELAGVYPDEDLGRLAREMAVRIYDRLGI